MFSENPLIGKQACQNKADVSQLNMLNPPARPTWFARSADFNRMPRMLESVPPIPSLYMFGVSLDALVASHGSLNFLGTPFGCYTKAKACENNFHRAAD